jgi:hypothetical protein
MSWLFSQALVAAYSGENSSGGEPCAQLSGTRQRSKSCWPDRMTARSPRSRSGRTSALSPHETIVPGGQSARFAASAIRSSSRAAFPALTLVLREKVKDWTAPNQPCGSTNAVSLARYDRAKCGWKTPQLLLLEEGSESLETLPAWGMTVGGELFLLPTPSGLVAHRASITSESGFGLPERVPTPSATEGNGGGQSVEKREAGGHHVRLRDYVTDNPKPRRIPTPRRIDGRSATENTSDGCLIRRVEKEGGCNLAEFVQMEHRGLVPRLPTPTAQDYGTNQSPSSGAAVRPSLSQLVKRIPTPTTQDAKNNGPASQMDRNTKPLNAEVGGPLNPQWVEWLMGWPVGWTDCAAPVTDKCLSRWLSLGNC